MLFGILQVAQMLGPPKFKNAVDPKDVKPTECGPFVVGVIVGLLILIVGLSLANGGQVVAIITPIAALMGLLILGGVMAGAGQGTKSKSKALKDFPVLPTQRQEADRLRTAISERTGVIDRPAKAPPEPVLARPEPVLARPEPMVATRAQVLSEEDLNERMVRVAQIMLAKCPTCTAHDEQFCTFQPGQPVTVLDRERGIIVHDSRVGFAVKAKTARVTDVIAQYGGRIPDSVWEYAL